MLSTTVNGLIQDLKPRQREILVGRFGLADGKKQTLADLGERYNITRERVRQIEEEALKASRARLAKEKIIKEILDSIAGHLDNLGGLRRDDLFIREIGTIFKDSNLHHWHLRFVSELSGQPLYYPADADFHNFWYLNEKHVGVASGFISKLQKLIFDKKEDLIVHRKFDTYLIKAARTNSISEFIGANYLSLSRKFSINSFGDWGLSEWEEINPKTVRQKSYLVLKKQNQPLHFREIADAINKVGFGSRPAHPQTVHNELIKDPRFVLVGRGIYGLAERGFRPGTAREIIIHALKEKDPLYLDEIVNLVQTQRLLKKNTIVLNLQNKKYFAKLKDGRFALK